MMHTYLYFFPIMHNPFSGGKEVLDENLLILENSTTTTATFCIILAHGVEVLLPVVYFYVE